MWAGRCPLPSPSPASRAALSVCVSVCSLLPAPRVLEEVVQEPKARFEAVVTKYVLTPTRGVPTRPPGRPCAFVCVLRAEGAAERARVSRPPPPPVAAAAWVCWQLGGEWRPSPPSRPSFVCLHFLWCIMHFPRLRRNAVPAYGKRKGFIPRVREDFGDGGAFPEIHIAQYPLDMGRVDKKSTAIVAVNVGVTGGKKVFQSATDLVEKRIDPVSCAASPRTSYDVMWVCGCEVGRGRGRWPPMPPPVSCGSCVIVPVFGVVFRRPCPCRARRRRRRRQPRPRLPLSASYR